MNLKLYLITTTKLISQPNHQPTNNNHELLSMKIKTGTPIYPVYVTTQRLYKSNIIAISRKHTHSTYF